MKLKEDNRGVSLVMVVSVVAIVAILVSIILAMGLYNYQMKVTNKNSKDNFYDAEQVLDEIRLGLQQDVSDAMLDAYYQTMDKYAETDVEEATDYFNDLYTENLRTSIVASQNESYYDMEHLLGFLDEKVKERTTLTTADGKKPYLNVNKTNGVTLKNLSLTYVNEEDYISSIRTDIQLKIPDINFSKFNTGSNIVQYALVAQKGITINSGIGDVTFNGNVYAGIDDTAASVAIPKDKAASVVIPDGTTVNVKSGKDFVVKDVLYVKAGGKLNVEAGGTLNVEDKATLWTKDIEAENASTLQLQGTTYVANDLTLLGGADVTISGEYYGFGNPKAALQAAFVQDYQEQTYIENTPADYSSAIIINALGTNSKAKLNLTEVNTLMLAGNAYIGKSKVMMGESLTVKSNQIAYLVPESCMMGASNPMTEEMRKAQLGTVEGDTEQEKELKFKNQILSKVQTGVSPDVEQIVQMHSEDGVYYYYMQFSSAKAADQYFANHYQSDRSAVFDKIKNYLQYYVEDHEVKINTDANAKKESNGNILVYDENGISAIGDSITEGTDLSENKKIVNQLAIYQDIFHALNTNLSMDYASLTNKQKARDTVFMNLFNTVDYERLFEQSLGEFVYDDGEEKYGARYRKDSVTSVKSEKEYAQKSGYTLKMIISKGDVTVDDDFDGLILADGKIEIKGNNRTVNSNPALVTKIIDYSQMIKSNDTRPEEYSLKEFMYDPDKYAGNFLEADNRSDNYIHLEDLVVYTNWSKQ